MLPLAARLADPRVRDLRARTRRGARWSSRCRRPPARSASRPAAAARPRPVDQHLRADHDVLVDAQRDALQRAPHGVRDRAACRGSCRRSTRARRARRARRPRPSRRPRGRATRGTGKPYCALQVRRGLGADRDAAGEHGRVGAHLGAALHAGVAADRHEARSPGRPTLPRASARLTIACTLSVPQTCWVMPIDQTSTALFAVAYMRANRRHVVDARRRRSARGRRATGARSVGRELVPARRCARATKSRSTAVLLDQDLEHAVQEGDVAADVDREELVGDLGAEDGRSRRWTAPSSARGRARGTG